MTHSNNISRTSFCKGTKRKFRHEVAAWRVVQKIRKQDKERGKGLEVYFCEPCAAFHFGNDQGKQNTVELNRVAARFFQTRVPQHLTLTPHKLNLTE